MQFLALTIFSVRNLQLSVKKNCNFPPNVLNVRRRCSCPKLLWGVYTIQQKWYIVFGRILQRILLIGCLHDPANVQH